MKPRRSATTGLVLLAAVAVGWLVIRSRIALPTSERPGQSLALQTPPTAGTTAPGSVTMPGEPSRTAPSATSPSVTPPASGSPLPAVSALPPAAATTPPLTDAQTDAASLNAVRVRRMVTDYHTLYGENPVGTNAEIMATLMGKNARQAVLGPPDGMNLNGKGELVDDWGTPYFFHQLSKDRMEIHSAGPDRVLGTSDDIVVR